MMNWDKLLSDERLGGDIEIPYLKTHLKTQFSMSEFEKDYWRIIDCASFRRLQDKTQVFPLDQSDFVRTRLTHSMEVSAIGKQLVAMVYSNLKSDKYGNKEEREKYPIDADQAKNAAEIVACAGLLHDIGNPPFGHFGEDIVKAWFENHLSELSYEYMDGKTRKTVALIKMEPDKDNPGQEKIKPLAPEEVIGDLMHFEGNAQAFRLLTKLHAVDSDRGLNLTKAVLNTIVKYPTDSMHILPKDPNVCMHKLGFYNDDREDFQSVAEATGTFFDGTFHRHPLTFILEEADDIAYATADLEDSYKKGLFTIDQFSAFFQEEAEKIQNKEQRSFTKGLIRELKKLLKEKEDMPLQAFQCWINHVRHWLMYCAAYGFVFNYTKIMEGSFKKELLCGTNHEMTMKILKKAMGKFTYDSPGILKLELAAETIIEGLMERLVPAAIDWDTDSISRATMRKAEEKLMLLVSENQKAAYLNNTKRGNDRVYDLYLRMLLVADFVSGMTDSYAKNLYQELSGI